MRRLSLSLSSSQGSRLVAIVAKEALSSARKRVEATDTRVRPKEKPRGVRQARVSDLASSAVAPRVLPRATLVYRMVASRPALGADRAAPQVECGEERRGRGLRNRVVARRIEPTDDSSGLWLSVLNFSARAIARPHTAAHTPRDASSRGAVPRDPRGVRVLSPARLVRRPPPLPRVPRLASSRGCRNRNRRVQEHGRAPGCVFRSRRPGHARRRHGASVLHARRDRANVGRER